MSFMSDRRYTDLGDMGPHTIDEVVGSGPQDGCGGGSPMARPIRRLP